MNKQRFAAPAEVAVGKRELDAKALLSRVSLAAGGDMPAGSPPTAAAASIRAEVRRADAGPAGPDVACIEAGAGARASRYH